MITYFSYNQMAAHNGNICLSQIFVKEVTADAFVKICNFLLRSIYLLISFQKMAKVKARLRGPDTHYRNEISSLDARSIIDVTTFPQIFLLSLHTYSTKIFQRTYT